MSLSGIADQRVVAGSAVDTIVSCTACDAVGIGRARQPVAEGRARDVLDRVENIVSLTRCAEGGEVDRDGGGDTGEGRGIRTKLADEEVITKAAIERVVAATVEVGQ